MKIKIFILYTLIIILLASCESHFYKMYLLTNDATGVVSGTAVKIRGLKIGKVTSLALYNSEYILITLEIDKQYKLPKSSTLNIQPSDFIGNKFISVKLGEPTGSYLISKDTLHETKDHDGVEDFGKNEISLDSIVKAIKIAKDKIKEDIMN